jgi:hypothetical protein
MWNIKTKKVSPRTDTHPDIEMHVVHSLHFDVIHIHCNHVSISHITYRKWRKVIIKNIVKYSLVWEDKQLRFVV